MRTTKTFLAALLLFTAVLTSSAGEVRRETFTIMSDLNLPPGCTLEDIDRSAGVEPPTCPQCGEELRGRPYCRDCAREANED